MADDSITQELSRLVRGLSTTLKSLLLYSLTHPRGRESANKSYDALHRLLERLPEISLGVTEGRIVIEENVLDRKDPVVTRLVEAMDERGLDSLTFRRGLDRDEFTRFLQVLTLKPEQVSRQGGYTELLANRDVGHAAVNDVLYGRISEADGLLDLALADQMLGGGRPAGGELHPGVSIADQIFNDPLALAPFQALLACGTEKTDMAGGGSAPDEASAEHGTADSSDPPDLAEVAARLGKTGIRYQGEGVSPDLLAADPQAAALAFLGLLEDMRRQGFLGTGLVQSASVVDAIEDLGQQLLAKSAGDWKRLRTVMARLILSLKPELQSLLVDRATSSEARQTFLQRILSLFPQERLGDLVASQYRQGLHDPEALEAFIRKLVTEGPHRKSILRTIGTALAKEGMEPPAFKAITDNILWKELPHPTKVRFLLESKNLWNVSFEKIQAVIRDLLAEGDLSSAVTIIRRYFSGLMVYDAKSRHSVVSNGFRFYQLADDDPQLARLKGNIAELLLEHLKNEENRDLFATLSRTLADIVRMEFDHDAFRSVFHLYETIRGLMDSGRLEEGGKRKVLQGELARVEELRVLERLLEAFTGGDREAEEVVPRIFGLLGPEAHRFLMTALAAETNRRLRARTVTLLRRVGGALVQPLVAALQDERWYLVRNAIFLLGDLGGPEQVEPVERCLVHPDARVRREACRALPKLGGNDAEDMLIRALNDPDEGVVAAGVEALGVLASPRGIDYMLDIVARAGSFADATDGLRKTAVDVLGRLQVAEAVDLLADILLRRTLLAHSESPRVRAAALSALASIGTDPALQVLENVASGDTSRRLREMADTTLHRVRQESPRR